MNIPLKTIIVGTGGWGKTWCTRTLPKAIQEGMVEVVAAVDVNQDHLRIAAQHLGLKDNHCFTDVKAALEQTQPQICIIASPPHTHEETAILAMEYGCDVLSEKPIADTLESSLRIVETSRRLNKKMGITMTHRFRRPIWTFRDLVRSGAYGELDYLIMNFNWHRRDGLKERQAKMWNTMLIEGAIHQLDLLENLAGAHCESVYMDSWTPKWGNYTGSAQALLTMRFENSVRASYETAWCNASPQHSWEQEYIRAEFEKATIVLNRGGVEVFLEEDNRMQGNPIGKPVEFKESAKWGNDYLLEAFIQWVHGGQKMETDIESNLHSMILLFASMESSKQGIPVNVKTFARENGRID
ncbi:Gfo/Idh/MocA family oxidoreductase [Paenibacillus sp. RC67]|uniref:Gfo/Idh/MocA family protein n=1 Tax=Paenibacillus sp. RC67 TaxID=3039392 RepID=UPI0024AC9619|nr:Gfo/Idh/MocA family oxidoreductase [Paenibacillus sp. RC67]